MKRNEYINKNSPLLEEGGEGIRGGERWREGKSKLPERVRWEVSAENKQLRDKIGVITLKLEAV